jgi:hypothetical protein
LHRVDPGRAHGGNEGRAEGDRQKQRTGPAVPFRGGLERAAHERRHPERLEKARGNTAPVKSLGFWLAGVREVFPDRNR